MHDIGLSIDRVTEEVLETMFFSGILGAGAGCGEDSLSALVEFTGSASGAVGLSVDRSAAETYTANFLGAPDVETQAEDVAAVVGEFANILCGATLAQLRPDGAFLIATPTVCSGEAAVRRVEEMNVRRSFELPEGSLTVGVSIKPESES